MARLLNVTFTGIDERTDTALLKRIQRKGLPFAVEFGVLLSENRIGTDPRYPSRETISRFQEEGLDLSLHLCGRIARCALAGDFSPVETLLGTDLLRFSRVQLNVSGRKLPEPLDSIRPPKWARELIIQRGSEQECTVGGPLSHDPVDGLSVLFDPSGGRGKDEPFPVLPSPWKVGYAGGINFLNVYGKLSGLLKGLRDFDCGFWIDMESGVRTRDWFDVGLVEAVLSQVECALGDWGGVSQYR